jgi:hypothetical protein
MKNYVRMCIARKARDSIQNPDSGFRRNDNIGSYCAHDDGMTT